MLFEKHYDTFKDYIEFANTRDDYVRKAFKDVDLSIKKNMDELLNYPDFPVGEYVNRLSLHEIRMLAIIKNIGVLNNEELRDFNFPFERNYPRTVFNYALYQHHFRQMKSCYGDSKDKYIRDIKHIATEEARATGLPQIATPQSLPSS